MRAYDLAFGPSIDELSKSPGTLLPMQLTEPRRAGWTGDAGPAIPAESWPRGSTTGLPMWHAITLELPEEYRRRGPEFVGISFFQGQGQFASPDSDVLALRSGEPLTDGQACDPFLEQYAESVGREHPRLVRMSDVIDAEFALIWLTREELEGSRTAPPPDVRLPDTRIADDEGPNAWDDAGTADLDVWIGVRDDPNTGKLPIEFGTRDAAGQPAHLGTHGEHGCRVRAHEETGGPEADAWFEWCREHATSCHLGGTSFFVQAAPEGLTPCYLEPWDWGSLNFGGGCCQIDLETGGFEWACG